ncbi:hypothetical protein GCM10027610_123020 [Dactylosporangium cerinum]
MLDVTAVLPLFSFLPPRRAESLTHVEHVPPRAGAVSPWPDWTPPLLRSAFAARGVDLPWTHQATAAQLAWSGTHTVIATGTGSGKSLAYQLPFLSSLLTDDKATVLYLSPTKALAADQLRSLHGLDLPGVRPASYDGDTPREERDWVRQHARVVLTNPDMLHHGILPNHASWTRFLRGLRFVVVDECHTYRGVFGSHVAHVLRRLRRVTARYTPRGLAGPCFILASATSGDPQASGSRLVGLPMAAVTEDASPRGGVTFALWEPPLLPPAPDALNAGALNVGAFDTGASDVGALDVSALDVSALDVGALDVGALDVGALDVGALAFDAAPAVRDAEPVRRSALRETADLLTDAVVAGVRTLAFVRSRKGAEVVASMARRSLNQAVPGLGERVAAYRAGYLREERRALERDLMDGTLLGLASTNALELGVDLVGLDAVLISGYPGTLASLWQQAGRAAAPAGTRCACW